jgi:hypothetical protein
MRGATRLPARLCRITHPDTNPKKAECGVVGLGRWKGVSGEGDGSAALIPCLPASSRFVTSPCPWAPPG